MPDIKSDLIDAENCFKNGGYVDNNGTFDKGKLNESYSNLENVIQNINNVITKTLNKITLLDKDIINYRNSYESANVNYRKARSSELGEKLSGISSTHWLSNLLMVQGLPSPTFKVVNNSANCDGVNATRIYSP